MARKTKDPQLELRAVNGMISAHMQIRNFARASQLIEEGLAVVRSLPPTGRRLFWEGTFYGHVGREKTRLKKHDEAIEALSHSISSYEGFLSSLRGNSKQVRNFRELVQGGLLVDLTWLADAYLRVNKLPEALEQIQRASNLMKSWGFNMPLKGICTELRKELDEAQKDYNDYLATLRKENKEQASLMSVEPLTVKQVQERLDPGITMLEYFVAANNVWLWVV
jgi:tetratricopeptide (TPR) repeat protein